MASVIYYLSYAKYRMENYKEPGAHLNSLLINMDSHDPPNRPKRIRAKRSKNTTQTPNFERADSSSDDMSSIDELFNEEERDNTSENRDQTSDTRDNTKEKRGKASETRDKTSENGDSTKKKKDKTSENTLDRSDHSRFEDNYFAELKDNIPRWGALITYKGKNNVKVNDTCSIDYMLLSLWIMNKLEYNFLNHLPLIELTGLLKIIIDQINLKKWDLSRQIWIVDVMKYDKALENNKISIFGTIHEMFIKYMGVYQQHNIVQKCDIHCENHNKIVSDQVNQLFFRKKGEIVQLHTFHKQNCKSCKKRVSHVFNFNHSIKLIFVEAASDMFIDEIPKQLHIQNNMLSLLCTVLHDYNHFIGVFELFKNRYIVDDLPPNIFNLPSSIKRGDRLNRYFNLTVSTAVYFREETVVSS